MARLALAGLSPKQIAERLSTLGTGGESESSRSRFGRGSSERVQNGQALARVLADHTGGIAGLSRLAAESGLDHDVVASSAEVTLTRLRSAFDRAVSCSPEAAVAAYSLGDAATLDRATAELVEWLASENLIGADRDVLDLGCGIGRVAGALAPRCRSVLGLDLSPGMIAEAGRRHAAGNLRFVVTPGGDLAGWPDGVFDLVLAVDTFPYLVQAGAAIAEQHVADAARLLCPGGTLAIFNFSYGRGVGADRADATRWAAAYRLALVRNGAPPFSLWDATAFMLRRPV